MSKPVAMPPLEGKKRRRKETEIDENKRSERKDDETMLLRGESCRVVAHQWGADTSKDDCYVVFKSRSLRLFERCKVCLFNLKRPSADEEKCCT